MNFFWGYNTFLTGILTNCKTIKRNFLSKNKHGKSLFAFTLAEVLITLGIIGVVAAMTLPTLIQNYQKKVTSTRLKKAYSIFQQAYQFSQLQNGEFVNWDTPPSEDDGTNTKYFVEKYFVPYFKGIRFCDIGNTDNKCAKYVGCGYRSYNYELPDGTLMGICAYNIKKQNVSITFSPTKNTDTYRSKFGFIINAKTGEFKPSYYKDGIPREDYLKGYNYTDSNQYKYLVACTRREKNENTPEYLSHACTALLYVDGWEIKDDYPW